MSDRYAKLTVVLDQEYRSEDLQEILTAIRMVKGVLTVDPHVADFNHYAAKQQAAYELRRKIEEVLSSRR